MPFQWNVPASGLWDEFLIEEGTIFIWFVYKYKVLEYLFFYMAFNVLDTGHSDSGIYSVNNKLNFLKNCMVRNRNVLIHFEVREILESMDDQEYWDFMRQLNFPFQTYLLKIHKWRIKPLYLIQSFHFLCNPLVSK